MPNPSPGESKNDFVKRCIPIVLKDGTAKDGAQAFAICTSMYSQKAGLTKDGLPASAFLVVDDPEMVTTWHLPVRDASGKLDHRLMGAAHAALLSPSGYRGSKYEGPSKGAAIDKLKKMYEAEGMAWTGKGFRVFKQADGSYRWVTISSSAFRDRDGEIITGKALAEDVERCDTIKEYGPLRWWHIGGWEAPDGVENWKTWKATSGVDLGTCDFNMLHGKMLIESGTFKNAVIGKAFSECQELLEVSIAFSHPPDEPGGKKEFENIHRFERSLLPEGMASNLLTKFLVQKGDSTMKIREKLIALASILKGNLAQEVLASAEGLQKAAEEAGLEFKEVEEGSIETPELTEDEVPEVKPEDEAQPITATAPDEVPVIEAPMAEAASMDEVPPVVEKVTQPAPAIPQEAMEPQTIGDMTPQQLADFVAKVVQQLAAKKEEEQAAVVQKTTNEKLDTLAKEFHDLTEQFQAQKESLLDLTDTRPVGIKRLQQLRPSEREDNITQKAAPTGPRIDPDFMKYASGGK